MRQKKIGLDAWRGLLSVMSEAHAHNDIEMNYMFSGGATYFISGRLRSLDKGRLVMFWAGMPHQLVSVEPNTDFLVVTMPLAWLLQWQLPDRINERLFGGDLMEVARADLSDGELLSRWVEDLKSGESGSRTIVMLELEARVRRMARSSHDQQPQEKHQNVADPVNRIIQFISTNYTGELSVAQIAGAVRLHPNYAMQIFKRQTGMPLWDYVIRLRIAHAQRLLMTTNAKIVDVALDSGFGSVSRFHEAFMRICRQSPRHYRFALRGENILLHQFARQASTLV